MCGRCEAVLASVYRPSKAHASACALPAHRSAATARRLVARTPGYLTPIAKRLRKCKPRRSERGNVNGGASKLKSRIRSCVFGIEQPCSIRRHPRGLRPRRFSWHGGVLSMLSPRAQGQSEYRPGGRAHLFHPAHRGSRLPLTGSQARIASVNGKTRQKLQAALQ